MTLNDLKCPKMALNDSKQHKMTRKDINDVNDVIVTSKSVFFF